MWSAMLAEEEPQGAVRRGNHITDTAMAARAIAALCWSPLFCFCTTISAVSCFRHSAPPSWTDLNLDAAPFAALSSALFPTEAGLGYQWHDVFNLRPKVTLDYSRHPPSPLSTLAPSLLGGRSVDGVDRTRDMAGGDVSRGVEHSPAGS